MSTLVGPLQHDAVITERYRVQGDCERTHCGWVYRATDLTTQQPVIIKCLSHPPTPLARAYFAQVQRCASRTLLKILDFIEPVELPPMLIIEAALGKRLDLLLADGMRLLPLQLLSIGQELALALAELQATGPIPVPAELISPSHIYLTTIDLNDALRITEVRITAHHYHAPRVDREGVTQSEEPSSVVYPTPEQAQSQPPAATSPQFQLGCLLHQLTTGEQPFLAPSLLEWLTNVMSAPTPKLLDKPPGMADLVERLLQKKPAARFPDLQQAAHAIGAVLRANMPIRLAAPLALDCSIPVYPMLPTGSAPAQPDVPLPGWIGVDAPRQLRQGTQALVRAVAIRDILQRELVEGALQQNNAMVVGTTLRRAVRLELLAADPESLGIKPLSPLEQTLATDELTVWEWLISAFLPGEHSLFLTITNLVDEPSGRSDRAQPSRRIVVHVTVSGDYTTPVFNTAGLRKLLSLVLPLASDFDALCIDHFPEVHSRFSTNMDRVVKVNLLLSYAEGGKIYQALKESFPQQLEQHAAQCALSAEAKKLDAVSPSRSLAALPHADFALRAKAPSTIGPTAAEAQRSLRFLQIAAIALVVLTLLMLALVLR